MASPPSKYKEHPTHRIEQAEQTLEALYRRYGPMVYRRCLALLANPDEAAEITQDVFEQLCRRQDTLDLSAPSSLLFKIATTRSLNRLRSHKRRPADHSQSSLNQQMVEDLAQCEDYDTETQTGLRQLLNRVFSKTPESTRLLAVLHYVDRMTLAEVARETGMSVSGVRKRLNKLQASAEHLSYIWRSHEI